MIAICSSAARRRLVGGALIVSALLASGTSIQAQDAATSPAAQAAPAVSYPPDHVLYETKAGKVTVGQFVENVRLYAPGPLGGLDIGEFDLSKIDAAAMQEAIKQTAVQDEAARRAREAGIEMEPARRDRLDRDLQTIEQRVWLVQVGILEDAGVGDDAIRAQYEADLDSAYTTAEVLSMRHIYLGTYETYEVKAGDSLESIAEAVSGDKSAAERILNADSRVPRAEETVGTEGEKLPPKALVEGEKLMVPMNAEKVEAVRAKAVQAWEKLKAGASFEEVAIEFGENPNPGRVMTLRPKKGEKPILAEMRAAFDALQDGAFSEPFRTKHGWQIVYRESYKPVHVTPFEEAREAIRRNLINKVREERYQKLMDALFAEYKDLVIAEDVLASAHDPARKDEIIFELGDLKYTAGLFARDMDGKFSAETPVAERRKLLAQVSTVQRKLTEWDKQRRNVRETPLFKAGALRAENIHLANRWLRKSLDDAAFEPTEEQLLAKFDEIKQMMRKEPAAEVWQLTVKAPIPEDSTMEQYQQAMAETTAKVEKELGKVTSKEDFLGLVKQMSEDEFASQDGSVGMQQGSYLGGMVGRALEASVANASFGPEEFPDGRVVAIWVGRVDKGQEAGLDAYRQETRSHVVREMEDKKTNELVEQVQKDIGLAIHVPPVAP